MGKRSTRDEMNEREIEVADYRVFIYTLADPRNGAIRYVGKTGNLEWRLRQHLDARHTKTHRGCWVQELLRNGVLPIIEVIEETTESNWSEAERFWIEYLRFLGFDLTNGDSGGLGGRRMTTSTRLKISSALKGRKLSEEQKRQISKIHSGKFVSEETRKRMGDSHRGIPLSEEHRKKLSAARVGMKFSRTRKARISAGNKGKKRSEAQKAKLSAMFKGRPIDPVVHARSVATRMARKLAGFYDK